MEMTLRKPQAGVRLAVGWDQTAGLQIRYSGVNAEETLGYIGLSGAALAAHVHFRVISTYS